MCLQEDLDKDSQKEDKRSQKRTSNHYPNPRNKKKQAHLNNEGKGLTKAVNKNRGSFKAAKSGKTVDFLFPFHKGSHNWSMCFRNPNRSNYKPNYCLPQQDDAKYSKGDKDDNRRPKAKRKGKNKKEIHWIDQIGDQTSDSSDKCKFDPIFSSIYHT